MEVRVVSLTVMLSSPDLGDMRGSITGAAQAERSAPSAPQTGQDASAAPSVQRTVQVQTASAALP